MAVNRMQQYQHDRLDRLDDWMAVHCDHHDISAPIAYIDAGVDPGHCAACLEPLEHGDLCNGCRYTTAGTDLFDEMTA